MNARSIDRKRFETSGFRTIELSRGHVRFKDGTVARFNVRLMAKPGSDGEVMLIAEDINSGKETVTTLRRKQ